LVGFCFGFDFGFARELAHPISDLDAVLENLIITKPADLLTLFHTQDASRFDEIARVLGRNRAQK
jgi:hypothetical protein